MTPEAIGLTNLSPSLHQRLELLFQFSPVTADFLETRGNHPTPFPDLFLDGLFNHRGTISAGTTMTVKSTLSGYICQARVGFDPLKLILIWD